ncbi:MAG: hypothetical protein ABWY64_05560, partial [Tardiphaga sp.]
MLGLHRGFALCSATGKSGATDSIVSGNGKSIGSHGRGDGPRRIEPVKWRCVAELAGAKNKMLQGVEMTTNKKKLLITASLSQLGRDLFNERGDI